MDNLGQTEMVAKYLINVLGTNYLYVFSVRELMNHSSLSIGKA